MMLFYDGLKWRLKLPNSRIRFLTAQLAPKREREREINTHKYKWSNTTFPRLFFLLATNNSLWSIQIHIDGFNSVKFVSKTLIYWWKCEFMEYSLLGGHLLLTFHWNVFSSKYTKTHKNIVKYTFISKRSCLVETTYQDRQRFYHPWWNTNLKLKSVSIACVPIGAVFGKR